MNTKTSATDEILNETAIGSFIAKNKGLTLAIIVGLIIAVIAYGFYSSKSQKVNYEKSDLIYEFKKENVTGLREDKVKPEAALAAFEALKTKVGSFVGMAPLSIEFSDELTKKQKIDQALGILTFSFNKYAKKDAYLRYMMAIRLSALHEDKKEFAKGADYLEQILSSKVNVMEDKIRMDLGRLYFHAKDNNKALLNLNHVIEKGTDNKIISLARSFKLRYGLN